MTFLRTWLPAAILAAACPLAQAADAYAPLRLYQGTWKATRKPSGGAAASNVLVNQCEKLGPFFECLQTVDGKTGALILFLPSGPEGHYYTQAVTAEGFATGRGDLVIEGSRWTYSSKSQQDGKVTYQRTVNVFSGEDRIHFEQAESTDGEHWTTQASGDEERAGGENH